MDGALKVIGLGIAGLVGAGLAFSAGVGVGATKRLQKQYKDDGIGDIGYVDASTDVGKIMTVLKAMNK